MIDQKKFVRMITRMFDKGRSIQIVDNIVTDGFIMYRGDFQQDIFYRLRLEAWSQMDMGLDKPTQLFEKSKDYVAVDMHLKYTLYRMREIDVYTIGKDPDSMQLPLIGFDKKFRELFFNGWEVKLEYKDEPYLISQAYIATEFGEIIVMPCTIEGRTYR